MSAAERPLGVGVVGLSAGGGWAAATHVPALARAGGVELSALTASSPESTQRAAHQHGVRGHADVAHLVADPEVHLVVVAVKTPDHAAPVRAALRAGKPVYCEWPLARSVAEAEELAALAEACATPVYVGLQGRSSPVLGRLRDLVAGGFVGEPQLVTLEADGLMGGPAVPARSRYQLDRTNGATVLTIPVGHLVDDLQHVLGPLRGVRAVTSVAHPEVDITTTGERLPSDSVSHVALTGQVGTRGLVSLVCRGGTSDGPGLRWRIEGSRGELVVEGDLGHPQMAELIVHGRQGSGRLEVLVDRGPERHAVVCLAAAYDGVVDALAGRPSLVPDVTQGLALHRLLDRLGRS